MVRALLLALCCAGRATASYCDGGPSASAKPNEFPISEPSIVHAASTHGGRLDYATAPSSTTLANGSPKNKTFPILHLYGEPYDWGYAQGHLLRARCIAFWDSFWDFLVASTTGGEAAVVAMLTGIEQSSRAFVPARFSEELRGLADATGYNASKLLWIHLYPESADGHCSMFGAWGKATQHSLGGELLQMRALDYLTEPFLVENHMVTVYHPTPGKGEPIVSVGFVGTVTMVTGMSAHLGLSEIGVSNPDDTFGPQRFGEGIPFNILLREVMMGQTQLQGVERALRDATRTLDLILGFGAHKKDEPRAPFTGVQYARDQVRFYDDKNMLPVNASWHAPIEDVVYHGMDWLCPAWTKPLGEKLRSLAASGNVNAAETIRSINAVVQTGDLHVAIYEGARQVMYIAQGEPKAEGRDGGVPAYDTPYMKLDVAALLAQTE